MIICSCNVITQEQIKQIKETNEKVTVSQVMKELNCNDICGCCMKNIVAAINGED